MARRHELFILVILIVISSMSLAYATNNAFIAKIEPVVDSVSKYDDALFNLTIINLENFSDSYSIYSPNVDSWNVIVSPPLIEVDGNRLMSALVRVKPKANVLEGQEYGVQINIRSGKDSVLDKAYAFVTILTQDEINKGYLPVVTIDVADEIGAIDPTDPGVLSLDIENKNIKDLKGLSIILSSKYIKDDTVTDLGPLKKKSIQFPLTILPSSPPAKDSLIVQVKYKNESLLTRSLSYEVLGVVKYDTEIVTSKSFLLEEYNVKMSNTANLPAPAIYKVKTNLLDYYLIHGNTDSQLKRIDGSFYKVYSHNIEVNDVFRLYAYKSYRPLVYILIAIILLYYLYLTFRAPIVLKKTVSSIKSSGGTISELKVLLHIKNRSKKVFEDLIILDMIPNITDLDNKFEVGTIKPVKIITNEKKGIIARWEINVLDSFEERVIVYKIKTNMKILGGLTLPVAVLKYHVHNGTEKSISSNRVKIILTEKVKVSAEETPEGPSE